MSYFNLNIPTQAKDHKIIANVIASSEALTITEIAQRYKGLTVVVTDEVKCGTFRKSVARAVRLS